MGRKLEGRGQWPPMVTRGQRNCLHIWNRSVRYIVYILKSLNAVGLLVGSTTRVHNRQLSHWSLSVHSLYYTVRQSGACATLQMVVHGRKNAVTVCCWINCLLETNIDEFTEVREKFKPLFDCLSDLWNDWPDSSSLHATGLCLSCRASFDCQDSAGCTGTVCSLLTQHTQQRLNVENLQGLGQQMGPGKVRLRSQEVKGPRLTGPTWTRLTSLWPILTLSFKQQVQVAVGKFVLTVQGRLKCQLTERE